MDTIDWDKAIGTDSSGRSRFNPSHYDDAAEFQTRYAREIS